MGSKVPGAVMTEPPTAKLPCSWIISGPVLPFLVCCALAEAKRKAGISQSAMKDFRRLLLILNHTPAALSAAKHSVITEGNPSDANAGRVVIAFPIAARIGFRDAFTGPVWRQIRTISDSDHRSQGRYQCAPECRRGGESDARTNRGWSPSRYERITQRSGPSILRVPQSLYPYFDFRRKHSVGIRC